MTATPLRVNVSAAHIVEQFMHSEFISLVLITLHFCTLPLFSFMGRKWLLSANLMATEFKFIKTELRYIFSQGRWINVLCIKCILYFYYFYTSACVLSPFHLREFLFSSNLPCVYVISDLETTWLLDEMFYLFYNFILQKKLNVTQHEFLFVFLGFSICCGIYENLIILWDFFLVDYFYQDIYLLWQVLI